MTAPFAIRPATFMLATAAAAPWLLASWLKRNAFSVPRRLARTLRVTFESASDFRPGPHRPEEKNVLYYAVVFFIVALIAALFGFGGLAAGAAGIAKVLFIVFLIVSIVTFLMSLARNDAGN